MSNGGLQVKARARRARHPDQIIDHPEVLVVEDERDLQELLKYSLERENYRVRCTSSGKQAIQLVIDKQPAIVLLDLMLPDVDGLEVCRSIRSNEETSAVAILMLTAKGGEVDVVAGLEVGADDYMTKPFSPRELIARVRAVLRRVRSRDEHSRPNSHRAVQIGDIAIDPSRHEVFVKDDLIDLTTTEFKLLYLLISRPGRVFTRQQIIKEVHGTHTTVTSRTVDVQILNLRRKLGILGSKLSTVRGIGYKFVG